MSSRWRAWLRLFAVQGAWNYERMLGIGIGYASEPLLAGWRETDPHRHREATARSAQFFNCHPYLAGVAVGAATASEAAAEDGEKILRLRTALSGTLGALGDQVFWAGLLPALMGLALVLAALDLPWWGIAVFLVAYNGCRLMVNWWCLRTGLAYGMDVGGALARSALPRASAWAGLPAALLIGVALPVVATTVTRPLPGAALAGTFGVAVVGLALLLRFRRMFSGLRLGLLAILVVVVWQGVLP